MKINYKRTTYIFGTAFVLSLLATIVVMAGNIDSPAAPSDPASQMYTLEDIYNRLNAGTAGAKMTTFTEPSTAPGPTMYTLNEIMAVAPAVDDSNGATTADVLNGKTFWSLTSGTWGLQTGMGMPSYVPKTGQTTPYVTGDDGQLQMGIAWPVPRFITGTTGVVTDTLTGLIWLENANCPHTTRDWDTALLADIAQLNTFGTMNGFDCGDTSNGGSHQTDWRLPNVREMQSLLHYGFYNPPLPNTVGTGACSNGDPFTDVQPYYYWSSTTRASLSNRAWSVDMISGEVVFNLKTNIYNVWPVRGGQ